MEILKENTDFLKISQILGGGLRKDLEKILIEKQGLTPLELIRRLAKKWKAAESILSNGFGFLISSWLQDATNY